MDSKEVNEPVRSRKHSNEGLVPSRFSKFGMMAGCSSSVFQDAPNCGFLTYGWPSWACGARARGWKIVLFMVKMNHWVKIIQDAFPSARILMYESGLELSSLPIKINAWFSDIEPPHSLALWSSIADIIVTSSKACL